MWRSGSGDRSSQSLSGRTLIGVFWMSSSRIVQAGLQLAVLVVLARLLEPAAFGTVAAALVAVSVLTIGAKLGLGGALIQRPKLEDGHIVTAFTFFLLSGVALVVLIVAAAPLIAAFFRIDAVAPVVSVMALMVLAQNGSEVASSLIQREHRFKAFASANVASYALGFGAFGIGLGALGLGLWALVAAHVAQALVLAAILVWLRPHPMRLGINRRAFAELVRYGGGMTVWRVANSIALQADNLVVGRWLGAEALGLYGRAYQLSTMPTVLLGQGVVQVLFPVMASVQQQTRLLAAGYRRGIAAMTLIALPLGLALAIMAEEVVLVALGPRWLDAVLPLQILSLGMLFRMSCRITESFAAATGAVYQTAWRQAAYAGAVFGGALIGQHWGLPGVALGILFALALQFALMAHLGLALCGLRASDFLVAHRPALLSGLVLAGQLMAIKSLLAQLGAGPVVVLLICAASSLLTWIALIRAAPRLFVGSDGLVVVERVLRLVPFGPTLGRALGVAATAPYAAPEPRGP